MDGGTEARPGAPATGGGLWERLGADMRRLRNAADVSLRTVETNSGFRRGTLSLIETGRSRPNRAIVEYYDETFLADGLLLATYAEARGAHGSSAGARPERRVPGDAMRVSDGSMPFGSLLAPGATATAAWTLHNTGSVAWDDRVLQRVGAPVAQRLIATAASVPVPACPPGGCVRVEVDLTAPAVAASYVAYWQMADGSGRSTLALDADLSVLVVVRATDE